MHKTPSKASSKPEIPAWADPESLLLVPHSTMAHSVSVNQIPSLLSHLCILSAPVLGFYTVRGDLHMSCSEYWATRPHKRQTQTVKPDLVKIKSSRKATGGRATWRLLVLVP